jgi:hypothetical protein
MFPNVRLMIAATLASVVALTCGFGMFAVFRVSHDPFVRLPAATAPLRLVADNAAKSSAGFASGEPFDRRFQVKAPPNAAAAANASAAAAEPRAAPETAPATPAQSTAAAPEDIASAVGEPTEQPSASTAPPTGEAPAATSANAAASDQANIAAMSQPETAIQTTPADAGTAAPSPETTTAEPDQDIKSPVGSVPSAEPAPNTAMEVAAIEPLEEPPLPRERPSLTTEPTGTANPADDRAHKTAAKKLKRIRVAVRIRRVLRVAAQYPQTQSLPTQYSPTTEQSFGDAQANFQAAPPSRAQFLVRRAIRLRHFRIASRKPREPNAATGGPFVSATSR